MAKNFDTVSRPDHWLSFGKVVPTTSTTAGVNVIDIDQQDVNGETFLLSVKDSTGAVSAKLYQADTAAAEGTLVATTASVTGSGSAKVVITGVTKRYLKCVYVGTSGETGTAEAEIYTGV